MVPKKRPKTFSLSRMVAQSFNSVALILMVGLLAFSGWPTGFWSILGAFVFVAAPVSTLVYIARHHAKDGIHLGLRQQWSRTKDAR